MNKKIIEVSESNYLNLFLSNLYVQKENEKVIIPISNIDTIIFENYYTTISIPLINEMVKNKISIIICDYNHLPNAQIIPFQGYYSTKILQNQIKWNDEYKGNIWEKIIKFKIINSKKYLSSISLLSNENEDKFNIFEQTVKFFDVTNREGHAAKLYFNLLFGKDFIREQKSNDQINSYLNYGYIVLLSYITRALCSKGYDPRISIFHKSFDNNYPLSCDIMEPFRWIIDSLVYEFIFVKKILSFQEYKESLFKRFQDYFCINGTKMTLIDGINFFINELLTNNDLETFSFD